MAPGAGVASTAAKTQPWHPFPGATPAPEPPAPPATRPARPPACHALLLGGLPGTPVHARQYRDWLKRFAVLLARDCAANKAVLGQVVCLSADKDFLAEKAAKNALVPKPATAASIKQALADMARTVAPEDQFILFMVGLGVTSERVPTFVVPGADLSAQELADALAAIRARNQVVLNFTSAAGKSVAFLSRRGRVVVSANMPTETVPPVYAEFFLRGLESRRADGEGAPDAGKKDGAATLLEAYNWAAFQTAQWIARQTKTGENTWKVDGAESVAVFRKLYPPGPPGEAGARVLDPASDASAPDKVVALKAQGENDNRIAESRRRVITEHAALEDCGAQEPVSALGDEKKDYAPLDGLDPPEPGSLARRVVLGSPWLLPAGGK